MDTGQQSATVDSQLTVSVFVIFIIIPVNSSIHNKLAGDVGACPWHATSIAGKFQMPLEHHLDRFEVQGLSY
ncbi:hypothetical protein ACOSP7_025920 [Xanthoceras sorbifolium]